MGWMGISEFARQSRLSPKALRLYDELGLLPPARVDPDTGYRWYSAEQLEGAGLVASLRQLGVPLAQIKVLLSLGASAAAERIWEYWAAAETEHSGRRELAGYLVDHLNGKEPLMYEVSVRDVPARSMVCLLRHMHTDELMASFRELMGRMRPVAPPGAGDPVTAPFIIFHAEVSEDSDGPAEICWPVPEDKAAEIAAGFPDLTLRSEAAHQEAFVGIGQLRLNSAHARPAIEGLYHWAGEHRREPSGGVRQIMIPNPANGGKGPDGEYAVPLK
jgi:DNA-binding transcriptional MerR regulator